MKRRSHWTEVRKPEVLSMLKEAGIEGDAAKTILRFERAKTTCWNRLFDGVTWETLQHQTCFINAGCALSDLSGNAESWHDKPKFWDEWVAYCEVTGEYPNGGLGDSLC